MCLPQKPADAIAAAGAIFEGRVLSVHDVRPEAGGAPRRAAKLTVVRSWKGAQREQIELTTAADSATCGYTFAAEESYLVYATAVGDRFEVSLCSRTRPMAEAGEDLQALGLGATPVDPSIQDQPKQKPRPTPGGGGCASCSVRGARSDGSGLAASAGLALIAGVLLMRKQRRR